MEEQVAESSTASATESPADSESTPQCLQRKIYFLVDNLRSYHAELPVTLQTRISYELLTELAHCVLNEGIFEIVKALLELQHATEKHLLQMRLQVENEYEIEVTEWCSKIKDPKELAHILDLLKAKHVTKLKDADKKIIEVLDQKVNDQQSTLHLAGVPGFYATQNAKEIKIQMFLLDFILRLSRLKYKPNK